MAKKDKKTNADRDALLKRAEKHPEHKAYLEMVAHCHNLESIHRINAWLDRLEME